MMMEVLVTSVLKWGALPMADSGGTQEGQMRTDIIGHNIRLYSHNVSVLALEEGAMSQVYDEQDTFIRSDQQSFRYRSLKLG